MIEAVNLVPDFLKDLVSNDLLDAFSWGEIRVEPLCQIAPERSIPDVTDILTATIVAGFGNGFEQLGLCHQGTDLPALSFWFVVIKSTCNRSISFTIC